MARNAVNQEFLDIVDNIKNGIDVDINKEKLRKFSQKDFRNYYMHLNKQRGVNFEDTILKAQMINIDPSNKSTFGFDLRKYSTDEIENFLTSEIDYIDSGKYFDKNKHFDIDKAIDDIVDPRMNGFEIVKNTNWYAGRKTGRIGWLGEEIEGSIDSGNWKRTDKFVDLENQEIRYVINETRVNPETGQVEVVNKNNVFTKDKDGNLIPYEFKNKKEEAVYAEKNPFSLDRDDNTVSDVEKELGRKVESSHNQVDTIEHTAINEYMNAVENGEITKPVGNNNSSTSTQQEISEPKKRRRKGNAEPLFAGEDPKDIVNSIDETRPEIQGNQQNDFFETGEVIDVDSNELVPINTMPEPINQPINNTNTSGQSVPDIPDEDIIIADNGVEVVGSGTSRGSQSSFNNSNFNNTNIEPVNDVVIGNSGVNNDQQFNGHASGTIKNNSWKDDWDTSQAVDVDDIYSSDLLDEMKDWEIEKRELRRKREAQNKAVIKKKTDAIKNKGKEKLSPAISKYEELKKNIKDKKELKKRRKNQQQRKERNAERNARKNKEIDKDLKNLENKNGAIEMGAPRSEAELKNEARNRRTAQRNRERNREVDENLRNLENEHGAIEMGEDPKAQRAREKDRRRKEREAAIDKNLHNLENEHGAIEMGGPPTKAEVDEVRQRNIDRNLEPIKNSNGAIEMDGPRGGLPAVQDSTAERRIENILRNAQNSAETNLNLENVANANGAIEMPGHASGLPAVPDSNAERRINNVIRNAQNSVETNANLNNLENAHGAIEMEQMPPEGWEPIPENTRGVPIDGPYNPDAPEVISGVPQTVEPKTFDAVPGEVDTPKVDGLDIEPEVSSELPIVYGSDSIEPEIPKTDPRHQRRIDDVKLISHDKFNRFFDRADLFVHGFLNGDYSSLKEYNKAVRRVKRYKKHNIGVERVNRETGNIETYSIDDIIKHNRRAEQEAYEAATKSAADTGESALKGKNISMKNLANSNPKLKRLMSIGGTASLGMNLFFGAQTYKEARKEGHSVLGSVARGVADFALGEALGVMYPISMFAQQLPSMAVKGIEGLGKLTREKNNMQRHEAFGYANFQDTQQLATMRQSGMEMAKMANYNLQQTLMGNEAKYMHR